jgi:hypothetical protein
MKGVDEAIEAEVKRRLAEKDADRDRESALNSIFEASALVKKAARILGKKDQNVSGVTVEKLTGLGNLLSEIGNIEEVATRAVAQAKEA